MPDDVEIAMLSATFQARPGSEADVAAALAKYVVLTRRLPGCRNVDLVASATGTGRFLVLEKWDGEDAARGHVDSPVMVEMASAVVDLLAERPSIDLWASISAHDLR